MVSILLTDKGEWKLEPVMFRKVSFFLENSFLQWGFHCFVIKKSVTLPKEIVRDPWCSKKLWFSDNFSIAIESRGNTNFGGEKKLSRNAEDLIRLTI